MYKNQSILGPNHLFTNVNSHVVTSKKPLGLTKKLTTKH
jgi:hypothetical protein